MLMTMISAGAMGGGISSAVARALGAGRREEADALVLHAVVINAALGIAFSLVFLLFGRPIYTALGGTGGALEAALVYSNTVFAGIVFVWLMNALASVIRGTGDMLFPAVVICAGVVFLIPASPVLIFGLGPVPGLGVAGGGVALTLFYAVGTLAMAWRVASGRNPTRFRWVRLRWALMKGILKVGAVSAVASIQTNVTIAGATALVAAAAGVEAVAGFGIGAPLVALVGTNIGAGRGDRALAIALMGGGLAFLVTEAIGIAAALWPQAWLSLFSDDPAMIAAGSDYLRIVGPAYGFFGLGMSLYFASQGAGRLFWPLASGFLRVALALGGGWLALALTGSLTALFAALAVALVAYGLTILAAVRSGAWFR
jgi:Na+-driven multidrug efflux pump